MHSCSSDIFRHSIWLLLSTVVCLFSAPAFAKEPIDGFRDLKFGMFPQEVQALPNCSTPQECIYELSNKNRYLQLTYTQDDSAPDVTTPSSPRLEKITIDMGQYTEDFYHQLQLMMGKSYRLTHDFTDETMAAFLAQNIQMLQAGYEEGQVVLAVVRRKFGNMTLQVVYQNPALALEFIRSRAANLPENSKPPGLP